MAVIEDITTMSEVGDEDTSVNSVNSGTPENGINEENNWLDILGNGSLCKLMVEVGSGEKPSMGQMVTIKYSIYVSGDETVKEEADALSFRVGDGDVLKALDLAVSLMLPGESAIIRADSRFAYGEIGDTSLNIPSNVDIEFKVTLSKVGDEKIDPNDMTLAMKLSEGSIKKERGNHFYSRHDMSSASNSYTLALKILEPTESIKKDLSALEVADTADGKMTVSLSEELRSQLDAYKSLRIACYNNYASVLLRTGLPEKARPLCESCLEIDPTNAKALYRLGKALNMLNKHEDAVRILTQASKFEPSDKAVRVALDDARTKLTAAKEQQNLLYRSMLQGALEPEDEQPTNTIVSLTNRLFKSPSTWGLSWTKLSMFFVALLGVFIAIFLGKQTNYANKTIF